jgi:hypothetical protein
MLLLVFPMRECVEGFRCRWAYTGLSCMNPLQVYTGNRCPLLAIYVRKCFHLFVLWSHSGCVKGRKRGAKDLGVLHWPLDPTDPLGLEGFSPSARCHPLIPAGSPYILEVRRIFISRRLNICWLLGNREGLRQQGRWLHIYDMYIYMFSLSLYMYICIYVYMHICIYVYTYDVNH